MRSGPLKGDRCWEGRERVREGCRQGRKGEGERRVPAGKEPEVQGGKLSFGES